MACVNTNFCRYDLGKNWVETFCVYPLVAQRMGTASSLKKLMIHGRVNGMYPYWQQASLQGLIDGTPFEKIRELRVLLDIPFSISRLQWNYVCVILFSTLGKFMGKLYE